MMNKIIFGSALLCATFLANASVQEFTYQSSTKNVTVIIDQINKQFAYVKKIDFLSPSGCSSSIDGGMIRGALNTKASSNFATFGWPLNDGNIQGMIGNAVAIYPSSVSWPEIEAGDCVIPASSGAVQINPISTSEK